MTSVKNSRVSPYLTRFNLAIFSIILIAIVGVVAFWVWRVQLTNFFGEDIFRLNYQFLLLVVIGGFVTFFLSEYSKHKEAQRQKKAKEQALQREFYQGLFEAYNTAKKVRRVLKARTRLGAEKIAMAPYDELMGQLIDSQLQFELLKRLAPIVFVKVDDSIDEYVSVRCALETIEKYLNKIVDEYEHEYKDAEPKSISELKWLKGFIGGKSGDDGLFKTEFTRPVDEVRDKVVELLNEGVDVDRRKCPKRIIVSR